MLRKSTLVLFALIALASCQDFSSLKAELIKHFRDHAGENPTHYGNPTGGCQDDELAGKITGVDGDSCLPKCTGEVIKDKCPTDYPEGDTAEGKCILKDTSGHKYCVLVCKGLGTGTCPTGATCEDVPSAAGVGICMYADGSLARHTDMFFQ